MSVTVTAEAPLALPLARAEAPASPLADALSQGFRSARDSGRSLKLDALKARLNAMRLMPAPADPRKAVERGSEAARLAREARALAGEDGADPALADEADLVAKIARMIIARARKAVKPGSREDEFLSGLDDGLGGGAVLDVTV